MQPNIRKNHYRLTVSALLGALVAAAFLVVAMGTASADQSPAGCTQNFAGVGIGVFRSDGTPIDTSLETVQPGEPIKYRATLIAAGGTFCDFEQGNLYITTPDGTEHLMASGLGIPKVTSTTSFQSAFKDYVVSNADVDPVDGLVASTRYTNGVSHIGNTHQTVNGGPNTIAVDVESVNLVVGKTVVPAYDEDYDWTLAKSVVPTTWDLFMGESAVSDYTVTATKNGPTQTNHRVTGVISVSNPSEFASATIDDVTDLIDGVAVDSVTCVDGAMAAVTFPGYVLAPGATITCDYSATGLVGNEANNVATAVVDPASEVGGDDVTVPIDWTTATVAVTDDTITVEDDLTGDTHVFSTNGEQWTYPWTFTCGTGTGEFTGTGNEVTNTVTIVGGTESASALVTTNCYDLTASKTADGTFDTRYVWDISKVADPNAFTLQKGEVQTVQYTVTVAAPTTENVNHQVSGTVTITNNHPTRAATINGVSDSLGPVDLTTCVDGNGDPAAIPGDVAAAGGTITCDYGPFASSANENTVTWTQQLYDFDSAGTPTADGTADHADTETVVWAAGPTDVIDFCTDVWDNWNGQGWVKLNTDPLCADGTFPAVYQYTMTFGTVNTGADLEIDCGQTDVTIFNTALVVKLGAVPQPDAQGAFDAGDILADAQSQVDPEAVCEGPTRTIGFWGSHPTLAAFYWDQIPEADRSFCGGLFDLTASGNDQLSQELLMGGFHQGISKTSTGEARTELNHARMIQLQQLLAAMLNLQAFNTDDGTLIADAKVAFCEDDAAAILASAAALDAWNNAGDDLTPEGFVTGKADPKTAKRWATKGHVNTFYNENLGTTDVL